MMSLTSRTTLVLNASFEPLVVYPLLSWKVMKTFRNVAAGNAIVLETYDEPLRSAHREWDHPSVIALKDFVRVKDVVSFNRINILIRDECRCQYCGTGLTQDDLTFDHVIPASLGGPKNFENIVAACVPCNARKANKTKMRPFREPRVPTQREMAKLRPIRRENVHSTWAPYLEWQGMLAPEDAPVSATQSEIDRVYWEGELQT